MSSGHSSSTSPSSVSSNGTAGKRAVVVGAGPVGALSALYLAKDGWDVDVYELRGDLRMPENKSLNFTKSINLALSERGISGMRAIDEQLLKEVLAETIPMYGREVHNTKLPAAAVEKRKEAGYQYWTEGQKQEYDVHGRFIRSADRARLNEQLLDRIAKEPNVRLHFHQGLKKLDLDKKVAWFDYSGKDAGDDPATTRVEFDFLLGCDGAHSMVRRLLQKYVRMDYEQTYIDTLWCELEIYPNEVTGDFLIHPNYLHIWPKQTFMFIAIPSPDKTFTCTLFMPQRMFDEIGDSADRLIAFFEKHFPAVIPLIGRDRLIKDYFKNPKLPLISVKCSPYHYKDSCVILGDAAHAMVPFYGQGMNAGFEDVRILFEHIHANPDIGTALARYSEARKPNAHSINDLAMTNYVEMRANVTSQVYKARKKVEEFLYDYVPALGITTQYALVSFSNTPYSKVISHMKWQKRILNGIASALILGAIGLVAWITWGKRFAGKGDALLAIARDVWGRVWDLL